MKHAVVFFYLLTLTLSSHAAWDAELMGSNNRMFVLNSDKNRFSIQHQNNTVDFVISISSPRAAQLGDTVLLQIDSGEHMTVRTRVISSNKISTNIGLLLEPSQKINLLNKMIGGLNLYVSSGMASGQSAKHVFPLLGYTAMLNDFLIASEIGRLDYEWLLEHHKEKELVCLYAATISITAMKFRLTGKSFGSSIKAITSTRIDILDNIKEGIVRDVYAIPEEKLPHEPRGEKHGIFRACMDS